MGMIQQSINQTLSLAGFMYSQTEHAKTQQKVRQLEKEYGQQEQLIKAQTELKIPNENRGKYNRLLPNYEKADDKDLNTIMALKKRKEELAGELYSISPNEHYQKLEDSAGEVEEISMAMGNKARQKAEEAEAKAEAEAEEAKAEAEEEAYYQRQLEEDAAELARREQSAAASETIRARILDPRTIADEELQKAIEIKKETNRRKGGMML